MELYNPDVKMSVYLKIRMQEEAVFTEQGFILNPVSTFTHALKFSWSYRRKPSTTELIHTHVQRGRNTKVIAGNLEESAVTPGQGMKRDHPNGPSIRPGPEAGAPRTRWSSYSAPDQQISDESLINRIT